MELVPGRTGAQSGYVCREKSGTPHVAMANRMVRKPITFTPSPAFTCRDKKTQELIIVQVGRVQGQCVAEGSFNVRSRGSGSHTNSPGFSTGTLTGVRLSTRDMGGSLV